MKPIPQYWAKLHDSIRTATGAVFEVDAWGWSAETTEEARQVAASRLAQLGTKLAQGGRLERASYYPLLPVREEVLEEIRDTDGSLAGCVTRNRYGARVLNTDRVLIADVDLPEGTTHDGAAGHGSKSSSVFGRLFGRGKKSEPEAVDQAPQTNPARQRIDAFAAANPQWQVRVYRTAAGYRVFVLGADAAPDSDEARQIMETLGTDPLYQRLCHAQGTYRARLTPKPWRVGMRSLSHQWPWANERAREKAEDWLSRYSSAAQAASVCRCESGAEASGAAQGASMQAQLIALHDGYVLANDGSPLA